MTAPDMDTSTLTTALDDHTARDDEPALPASDEADEILISQLVTFEWMAEEAAWPSEVLGASGRSPAVEA